MLETFDLIIFPPGVQLRARSLEGDSTLGEPVED